VRENQECAKNDKQGMHMNMSASGETGVSTSENTARRHKAGKEWVRAAELNGESVSRGACR
jgi:hypothetical protein